MKFDKLAVGMVLWDVHSVRMGNTTMKTLGTWQVKVLEIDTEKRRVFASWNGNPAQWHGEAYFAKLKATKPILIREGMGYYRRPTREELKAIRAQEKEPK